MNHKTGLLLVLAFGVIVGCTPKTIKMDTATMESLNTEQQITAIHYRPASFEMPAYSGNAYAGGGAIGGVIGGAIGGIISGIVTHSQGERILAKFNLQDPISFIKEEFSSKTLGNFSNIEVAYIAEPFKDDDIDDLKETFGEGKILDFQTIQWGIVKHTEGWEFLKPARLQKNRKLVYFARARLVDTSTSRVLWQGICDVEGKHIFTMEDVKYWNGGKDNNLEGLFKVLSHMCLKELGKQFTNTNPQVYARSPN